MPVFHKVGHPDEEAVYELRRAGSATYRLREHFEYSEPARRQRTFKVPKDLDTFKTDFASVPVFATWLVPRDGTHTPAAFLHDALVRNAHDGDPIANGTEADTVFRDALGHLDVALLRRWMMWAAVSLRTLTKEGKGTTRARYWVVIAFTVLTCAGVSVLAVVDFIRGSQDWRPGVLDNTLTDYLWVGALVAPLLWHPHVGVGAIAAAALVVFAVPLLAATIGFGVYWLAEEACYAFLQQAKQRTRIPWTPPGPVVAPKRPHFGRAAPT